MDNSMQDIISRYSRELLEYGKQHGGAVSEKPQTVMPEQKSKKSEPTYAPKSPKVNTATPQAAVLYEDFHEAGILPNAATDRVVFAAGKPSAHASDPMPSASAPMPQVQTIPAPKKIIEQAVQAEIPEAEVEAPPKKAAVRQTYVKTPPPAQNTNTMNMGDITHEGHGWLKVQVYQSEARYPLEGARVVVFRSVNGRHHAIYDKTTDSNGMVGAMVLPAPRKEFSLSPRGMAGKHAMPYATYNLYVEHPSFLREIYPEISVFDGVDSVKPVILTPKAPGANERMPTLDFYA